MGGFAQAGAQIGAGAAAGAAAGPVGAAVGAAVAAVKVGIAELVQHSARLKDAEAENTAIPQAVEAWDADVQAVVTAFNNGQVTATDAISALQTIDQQTFAYLYSLVGKAGTAWSGPTTQSLGSTLNPSYTAPCNKTCTVSCCVYLNDLRPWIYGDAGQAAEGNIGLIQAISQGSGVVHVSEIFPPSDKKYGNYSRPAYTLNVQKPLGGNVEASILSTIDNLLGKNPLGSLTSKSTSGPSISLLIGAFVLILLAIVFAMRS